MIRQNLHNYAFEGEQGMWSAGAFQGTGMGFGVWCRDTMQMLLRGIGFIESGITRRTVEYILKSGKDNAVDGLAAVVISVWEYYLVSHDRELLLKNADTIKAKIQQCEKVFNEEKGLVMQHSVPQMMLTKIRKQGAMP